MSTLQEIEDAISRLSPDDQATLRAWLVEFYGDQWDRQIEADAAAGRLDWLADEAREDLRAGRTTER
jgi:hypothetical protein